MSILFIIHTTPTLTYTTYAFICGEWCGAVIVSILVLRYSCAARYGAILIFINLRTVQGLVHAVRGMRTQPARLLVRPVLPRLLPALQIALILRDLLLLD